MSDRSYLDHAATTAMLPDARAAWLAASEHLGNPSSLHAAGRSARKVVEESRESIAADLKTRPSGVIFTAGGTEANNLAVKGLYWQRQQSSGSKYPMRVLASAIEHHAVMDPVVWLGEHEGAIIEWLGVNHDARISIEKIAESLAQKPAIALCTVMWANNEVGTIQPVERIAELCKEHGVPFHTDAVQVPGQVPMNLGALGADAVTISSHKVGGPFGVGALIVNPATGFTPLLHGGGQERDIRSGTFDAPAIAAFAVAVRHAVAHQEEHARAIRDLRNDLVERVLATVPGAILNGDPDLLGGGRLPGNAHFSFPGCEGDSMLMLLDAAGVDCSTGSACTAGIPEASHVLLAMGVDERTSRASLRFSFGYPSSSADVDRVVAALPGAVDRASRTVSSRST